MDWRRSNCQPYVQPRPPGLLGEYEGFTNTILEVDGPHTRHIDQNGRYGSRLALFIWQDPRGPVAVDTARLAELWPLRLGTEVNVPVQRGEELAEGH
jgi:hypothetical protein